MNSDKPVANKLTEFPFPLSRGARESHYLTWLRNHSNYMATRGLLDYFRMAGVLLRGIILNFLIVLSLLLLISIAVALLYDQHLKALPAWDYLPAYAVDTLAEKLVHPKRPIDHVVAQQLSAQTTQALTSENRNNRQLRAFLINDFRDIIDNTAITPELRFSAYNTFDMDELNKTVVDNLQERVQNRLIIDRSYPEELLPLDPKYQNPTIIPPPYTLTVSAAAFTLVLVLLSPLGLILKDIATHRKSVRLTGSGNSVKSRDIFERVFGSMLFVVAALALFESIPLLMDQYQLFRSNPQINWDAIFASAASVSLIMLGTAGKILPLLGKGFKQKLMLGVFGLVGLVPPLLMVLHASDILVYTEPHEVDDLYYIVYILPALFAVVVLGCLLLGWARRSFTFVESLRLLALAFLAVAAVFVFILVDDFFIEVLERPVIGLASLVAIELWLFCRFLLDINQTSIHGLYRDRLASAYLVGVDTKDDIDIEKDIKLSEIGWHAAGSTAPYHLINTAINLQNSKNMSIRDRNSDFFIFSKRYIGGNLTGYCRTKTMEQIQPRMSLATAMAISAAAASPNMGRSTNPALVALMVLFNIRLGYWLPNPGLLEYKLSQRRGFIAAMKHLIMYFRNKDTSSGTIAEQQAPGFTFEEVFQHELKDISRRWQNVYPDTALREPDNLESAKTPGTQLMLIGLAFSGGGIRSATFNLGIAQALHQWGIFKHVDYLSTVSGGGYLGSSLSTLMRGSIVSDIDGKATLDKAGKRIIVQNSDESREQYHYPFSCYDQPLVQHGDSVIPGQPLINHHDPQVSSISGVASCDSTGSTVTVEDKHGHCETYYYTRFDQIKVKDRAFIKKGKALVKPHNTFLDRFRWRVKPSNLVREILMKLDETHKWVNLSDGGHIENLAGIELLRRRCKLIIIGDGEADPNLTFNGLANLIRLARIDLGIRIDINPDPIRIDNSKQAIKKGKDNISARHWAVGSIHYPADANHAEETGRLLYLKSSYTDKEDVVIKEYRQRNPSFPHESTADQFFSEEQFECYRSLGQHVAESMIKEAFTQLSPSQSELQFSSLKNWMEMDINESEAMAPPPPSRTLPETADKTAYEGVETQI